jgi:DNA-binding MarR family transcriptional regulator
MAKHGAPDVPPSRAELEKLMAADLRAMTARSDRVGRYFARQHDLHSSDLQALLHIMVAETAGEPLNSSQLRERMGISNAAITYLVDRVMSAGHIRREADPTDRRKSLLRLENQAMGLGREFFGPLGAHLHSAVAGLSDDDLLAAHQVLTAMTGAMSTFEEELRTKSAQSANSGRRGNVRADRRQGGR